MTTQPVTQKKRQKEFQAVLSNIDTIDHKGQPYKDPVLVFPPQPGHGIYPVRIAVKKERADKVTKGALYHVIIEQGYAKKEAPRLDTDWYWDIVDIEPVAVAQTPATVPAAAPKQAQSATFGPETGKAPPQQRGSEFRTPAQIMRCLALEVAGRNLDALIGSQQEIPEEYVLERAAVYARFLETGEGESEGKPSVPQPGLVAPQLGASAQAARPAQPKMGSIAFWKAVGAAGEDEDSIELKLGKTIPAWLRDNPGKGYEGILELVLEEEAQK